MEVADSDIQKRLKSPYVLVLRASKQELATRMDLFSDVLRDRQRAYLSGMVEWAKRQDSLLDLKRAWFVKYNKPVYYQPKEFKNVLKSAKKIIIPRHDKPPFVGELKDFLKRNGVLGPRIIPLCESCLRENRLTVLTRRNAVKSSDTSASCLTCAQSDLKTDLKSLGFDLSKAMISQLEKQLARVKSVPRMIDLMTPGFDPSQQPDLTLVDEITAEISERRKGIDSLPLPDEVKEVLASEGLESLLPIQELVIEAGLLKDESLLIVSSTSSGKTLLGELAGVPKAMSGKRMVYLSPLVALTNEKYELFRSRYKKLGLKVGIKVGMSRLDVGDEGRVIVDTDITKSDIICATYEALDLLFRSGNVQSICDIGTVIIDEIQNLSDPERGPELDGLLARLRFHSPKAQILGLSATIGSPEKLARELKLKLVNSVGRPVPLERHLVFARNDDAKRTIIRRLVKSEYKKVSSFGKRGQSIIFTFSRRRSHALQEWLHSNGVSSALYHGGLSYVERRRTEKAYGKQRFSCIVTTAALGAGVDLPASQVIFESLAMGADWLSTAEFEQMLGRAGRLGKHDRGKVYLVVEPGRKYHGGQDKCEDEIAADLLRGDIEEVEPFADTETSAEQILATICSTGLVKLKDIARAYNRMLSVSVPPSDALKRLVRTHMIRVKEGGAHPTELGLATSLSFLTPSRGYDVLKASESLDVLDIAISLDTFENVYLSSRLQGEVDTAFRTHMPTRLFSGVFADLTDLKKPTGGSGRLPKWVFEVFGKWTTDFFNCGCRDFPECDHGKIKLGKWIVERRLEGLNPSVIARKLINSYELWAYPGDLFSWLDSLIHNLNAVKRIAAVAGKTDLGEQIEDQIARIERPLTFSKSE
ncbi:MAG: DEAD/DEAH box helicase [Candidatus Thorarchaeota archaeon]|nr:MAG: DEAD/DEAH box helicase [Candidatus Thorarchaeota archaeon]